MKKKDKWLQIRVSQDKKDEIQKHATEEKESLSEFVVKSVDVRIKELDK